MPVVTSSGAADFLNGKAADPTRKRPISPRRLRQLANAGEVPVLEWTGNGPLFSTAELERWANARRATRPQAGAA